MSPVRPLVIASVAALVIGLPGNASAYHASISSIVGTTAAWPPQRMPVPFRIDRNIVKTEPELLPLVRDGLAVWGSVDGSYVGAFEHGWTLVETTLATVENREILDLEDGLPDLGVDYSGEVLDFFGIDIEAIAGIGVTEVAAQGIITDGFVVLNGTLNLGQFPIQATEIAAHEVGHVLSLGHSGITTRFMDREDDAFPTMSGPNLAALLSTDDRAVVAALYPDCDFESRFGAITGRVLLATGNNGAEGVSVTALSTDGVHAVGHLSGTMDGQGTYYIAGVPAGDYTVWIEPLDGSQDGSGRTPDRIDPFFNSPTLGFAVEGFDDAPVGSGEETVVTVAAGRTVTGVDFVIGENSAPRPAPASVDGAAPAFLLEGPHNNLPLNGAPLAAIDVDATTVLVGEEVAFDASASRSCAGATASWTWDFGDGTPSVDAIMTTHAFGAPGRYDVVVIVTDVAGNAANHLLQLFVVDELPPEPEPPGGCSCRVAAEPASGRNRGALGVIGLLATFVLLALQHRCCYRRRRSNR